MNIILASASPRRSDILKKNGYIFKIIPSEYNENICNNDYSPEVVKNCAYNKALDISKKTKEGIIIGADTVVVLENKILGKPKDENEAFLMLKKLSGNTHFVATSICLINAETNYTLKQVETTFVTFRDLSDKEISDYIKNSKPLDKAGSYGIQDKGFDFAAKVDGELDNVIGFPIKLFKKMIADIS